MTRIRLLPVVILAVAALLVLKTIGLVTHGGYVLTGVTMAEASGGGSSGGGGGEASADGAASGDHTISDTAPTLADTAPTLGAAAAEGGGHGASTGGAEGGDGSSDHGTAPADGATTGEAGGDHAPGDAGNVIATENACDPQPVQAEGEGGGGGAHGGSDAGAGGDAGQLMVIPAGCPPLADAVPQQMVGGQLVPMNGGDSSATDQTLLDRLAARRQELENYQKDLDMRASLVDAAEKRLEERSQTLQALEDQISGLVEQRKQMEEGQFAGIVAMYEAMKPRDAAAIFNTLDIDILVRVAKMISPRKMAPILAAMDTQRAQELTVRLASASADPVETMTPDNLAALPQIVGQ